MKLLRILLPTAFVVAVCGLVFGLKSAPVEHAADAACADCHVEYPAGWTPAVVPPDHGLVRAVAVEEDPAADDPGTREAWEWLRLRDPLTGLVPLGMRRREVAHARALARRVAADKTVDWRFRGPHNVGGRTRALAIDLADPTYATLLAGGVSGGLWRSVDDGANWSLVTDPGGPLNITCLAQDPRPGRTNEWYLGTGEKRGASTAQGGDLYRGDGLWKSVDGGLTWAPLTATSSGTPTATDNPFDFVQRIAVDPTETVLDEVYAAVAGSIQRSVDGGATWTTVLGDPDSLQAITDVIVTSAGVVYAGFSCDGPVQGVWRSPDGLAWTDITSATLGTHSRVVLRQTPSNPDYVYVLAGNWNGTYDSALFQYRYFNGDGSGSSGFWSNRSYALRTLPHWYFGTYPYRSQSGYCATVAVHPNLTETVYLGGVHLWRSPNGFTSTYQAAQIGGWLYDNHHADLHDVVFRPGSSSIAYTASDAGVHKTLDINASTVAWTDLGDGLHTSQFYAVGVDEDAAGSEVVVGGTQDNGTLWSGVADPAAQWLEPLGGDGMHCAVASADSGDYYLSWYRANIMRIVLDPAGAHLDSTYVSPVGGGPYLFVNPFVLDPLDHDRMYLASAEGVWRNDDLSGIPMGGVDETTHGWTHLTTEPSGEYVSAFGVGRGPDRPLYYGTADGSLYRVDAAPTAPTGVVPTPLHGNAAFPAGAYVSDLAVHPEDERTVLLSFANYNVASLWLTRDGGLTWTDVEGVLGGPDGPSVRAAAILPRAGDDLLLVGTSTGLWTADLPADDSPPLWTLESPDGLGLVIVDDVSVRPVDGRVTLATHGRGIWAADLDIGTGASDLPAPGRLAQNVPNPFNPSTSITLRPPRAGRVTLDVFDVRGRFVRRLLDAETDGETVVRWDGRDAAGREAPGGLYLYQARASGWSETRKMQLVR